MIYGGRLRSNARWDQSIRSLIAPVKMGYPNNICQSGTPNFIGLMFDSALFRFLQSTTESNTSSCGTGHLANAYLWQYHQTDMNCWTDAKNVKNFLFEQIHVYLQGHLKVVNLQTPRISKQQILDSITSYEGPQTHPNSSCSDSPSVSASSFNISCAIPKARVVLGR